VLVLLGIAVVVFGFIVRANPLLVVMAAALVTGLAAAWTPGVTPDARYVVVDTYDGWYEGYDLFEVEHPQTILAYGMNGRDLPIPHGAPVRLRVERQMGYKSMKFLRSITVTDQFEDGGKDGNIQTGWAWYTGI